MSDIDRLIAQLRDPRPPHHGKCLKAADTIARLRAAFPKRIGRLTLGERLSHEHYCGGSHEMPDGQPIYWQERGGEYPDDIEGFCLTCAIQNAESDAGWCECSARAALEGEG